MTRIVLLIDVLTNINAGAERQIYEFIKGIDKEKFKVYLYVLHHKNIPEEMKKVTNDYNGLGIQRIYGIRGILAGLRFKKFLKREKVSILMTYHFASDIWGTIFGKLSGIPVIISNRRDAGFWRNKWHILSYRLINRWVNKIFAVSKAVETMVLKQEGVSKDKIKVVYNGIDSTRLRNTIDIIEEKKQLGLSENSQIIGYIGNLRPIKGHVFLIEAAYGVVKKFPNTHFILVGEGELEKDLKSKVKNLKLQNNIHFLGKRKDIPKLLEVMDLCVLPSLSEGFSNALLEYMAAGKPVIATNVGGNPEIVEHEINGILVSPKDHQSLENQIIRLLENRDFAYILGKKAQELIINKFDQKDRLLSLEGLLEKELEKQNSNIPINRNFRILHLISSGGYFGAEKVMLNLASNIHSDNISSYIVAIKNLYNPHLEIIDKARELNIPHFIIESRNKFDLRSISQLTKIIKENNIDLVHSHNYKANFIGFLASKITNIPIVATLHGYINNNKKLKAYEIIDRFLLKFFNKVVFVDKSFTKIFKSKNGKFEIINNGIYIESNNNQADVPNNGHLIIGTVGRLSHEKGHKYLLEAFIRINKEYPNSQLMIVGDGELKGELENISIAYGIKNKVDFVGYRHDALDFYPKFDIYVSPSLTEHFPMSILEAMNFGKAVIATDVGGVPDLIKEGVTGLLVKPRASTELYNAILNLIKDISLRKKLGENARQFVHEKFSLEKMTASYRRVYKETLASITL